jgi:hypothetical protein
VIVAICCDVQPASDNRVTVVPRRSWKCSFTGRSIFGNSTDSKPPPFCPLGADVKQTLTIMRIDESHDRLHVLIV